MSDNNIIFSNTQSQDTYQPLRMEFTPYNLSPAGWWDASEAVTITSSSGSVSAWADKSGNGWDLAQATGGYQPSTGVETINGLNVISFDEATPGEWIGKDGDNTQNWQDTYVVARWDGGSTFNDYDGLFTAYTISGTVSIGIIGIASSANIYSTVKWWDNAYLNASTWSSPYTLFPTGQSTFLLSFSANSAIAADGVALGTDRGRAGGERTWRGPIAEVVSFSSKLSDANRQKVEGYLAHKWGLTASLPSGHPYKVWGPTV